jgi:hypothetical protein
MFEVERKKAKVQFKKNKNTTVKKNNPGANPVLDIFY